MKFKDNEKITLLGDEFTIQFQLLKTIKGTVVESGASLKVYLPESQNADYSKVLEDYLIKKAREYATGRATFFCEKLNTKFNKISIKDTTSRWGSCSAKKNLNFSWKLILLPAICFDYVVLHEVAHLVHLNHSSVFWNLIASQIPEYQEVELILKKNAKVVFL